MKSIVLLAATLLIAPVYAAPTTTAKASAPVVYKPTKPRTAARLQVELDSLARDFKHVSDQLLTETLRRVSLQVQNQQQQQEIARLKAENAKLRKAHD